MAFSKTNFVDNQTVIDADTLNAIQDELIRVAGLLGKDIQSATINDSGHLILTLTDGTTLDAGVAKGADGAPGIYYGTMQPTGDIHPVWIDPNGMPDELDLSLGITSATVGQLARIKAVDRNGAPTAWEAINHTWTLHQTYNLKDLTFPAAISIPQKKDVYILLEGTDITPDKNTNVNITMATTSQVGGYGNRGEFSQKLYAHGWGSGMMMLLLWRDNAASFKQYRTGWCGGYEYTPYKETLEWMDTGRLYLRITVDDATKLNANTTATIKVYTRDYI